MPPTSVGATLDAAQELGNKFTRALETGHDDDEAALKADVKNVLCEIQDLCIGLPLAHANRVREEFINEILQNLASTG